MHGSRSRYLLLALALATLVAQGGCAVAAPLAPGAGTAAAGPSARGGAGTGDRGRQPQQLANPGPVQQFGHAQRTGLSDAAGPHRLSAAAQLPPEGRNRLDRAGSRPGQQRSTLLVLDQAQPAAGGLLLPPRPVPHEPGAADDPHRSQLADRGPRHAGARPVAAAPGSVSRTRAIGFKSAPSAKRPRDRT